MVTVVQPTPHVQLTDIIVEHEYADDESFEQLFDEPVENLDDDTHYHQTLPIHRNARVIPDDQSVGFTSAKLTFERERFYVEIMKAPRSDWFWTAHGNVLGVISNEYNIEPAERDGVSARYNHGIPHPLLDAKGVDDMLSPSSTTVTSHDADWYDPSHTVVRYDLDDGPVYLDLHSDTVFFEEQDLAQEFSYHIANALQSQIDQSLIDVRNPHEALFDEAILYPAFAQEESLIPLWNSIAENAFSEDFASKPDQALRNELQSIGIQPLHSLLGWILIGCCLEYNMPDIGGTRATIEQTLGYEPTMNWNNTMNALGSLAEGIKGSIDGGYYDYAQDALPEYNDYLRIHAGDDHMQLAVTPIAYRPVFYMGESDNWDDGMAIEDFFWAEGGWYLRVEAARPCDAEDGDFDPTEVYDYIDGRNGNRVIVALASNIEDAEPITQDEVDETMVSVAGAPTDSN